MLKGLRFYYTEVMVGSMLAFVMTVSETLSKEHWPDFSNQEKALCFWNFSLGSLLQL